MLVGFHGYAESDEIQLERLHAVPGSPQWVLVAIQGLHRFYRGRGADRMVAASWMTRQDRELAIADNLAYVKAVIDGVGLEHEAAGPLVFAGFSQGVAMAFRAAALLPVDVDGVLAVGGDVPPDIDTSALGRIGRVLLGRGTSDPHYSREQWTKDASRLREAGVDVEPLELEGGHVWGRDFSEAAGAFLTRVRTVRP